MGEGALSYPVHPESGSQMPGTPTLPTSLTAKPLFCSGRRPPAAGRDARPLPQRSLGVARRAWPGAEGARVAFRWESSPRPAFLLPAAWNSGERADAPAAIVGYEVTPRWETHGRSFRTE